MSLLRYLRLYGYFVRFSTSRTLEFRIDFFFRVFMDLVYYGVNIAFYGVIFLHTELLGGWTRDQSLVFMGGFLLVDAIVMTLFSNNIWWLPILINRGDLDYYLLRPVSSLFFLSVRDFAVNSFINLRVRGGHPRLGHLPRGGSLDGRGHRPLRLPPDGGGLPALYGPPAHDPAGVLDPERRQPAHHLLQLPALHGTAGPHLLRLGAQGAGHGDPLQPHGLLPGPDAHRGAGLGRAGAFRLVIACFFALLVAVWKMGLRAYSSASS